MDKRFIVACILLIAVVAFFPTSEANPRFRRQVSVTASAGANTPTTVAPISPQLQQLIDKLNSTLSHLLQQGQGLPSQLLLPLEQLLAQLNSGALTAPLQQLLDQNPLLPTLPIQDLLKLLSQTLTGNLRKLANLAQTVVGILLSPLALLLGALGAPLQLLTGLGGGLLGGGGGGGAQTLNFGSLLG